jgi:hypothetical protein
MFLFNRNILLATDPLAEFLYLKQNKIKNNEHTLPKHKECSCSDSLGILKISLPESSA